MQAYRATGQSGIYWVMTDARIGEVYTAIVWVDHQSLLVIKDDCVMAVNSLSDFMQKQGLNQERITLVGDGWHLVPNYAKHKLWVKPNLDQKQWLSKAEVMVKMFQQSKPDVRSCFRKEDYQQIEARYLREHRV
jgi:tRNA A37 threonylcarbamoyladenosine modification protein TsaB